MYSTIRGRKVLSWLQGWTLTALILQSFEHAHDGDGVMWMSRRVIAIINPTRSSRGGIYYFQSDTKVVNKIYREVLISPNCFKLGWTLEDTLVYSHTNTTTITATSYIFC